jgi:hypothetical protein
MAGDSSPTRATSGPSGAPQDGRGERTGLLIVHRFDFQQNAKGSVYVSQGSLSI